MAVLALGAWALLITAWVCDDAYISFRVVDNLVNGYGMRWNVGERVQAFSNPLWVLLLAMPYAATGEIYYTCLVVSALLALATLWIVMHHCARSIVIGIPVAVALVVSPTFIAFSTSGLENPLTHFLVAVFCAVYVADISPPRRKALALSLLASLAAFNRLDNALLIGVPLAWLFFQHRTAAVARAIALGALPIVAWEAFAVVYYGTPIPNTAFAKLATGIPAADLVAQAVTYFDVSTRFDPMGAMLVVAGTVIAPMLDRRLLPLALGIALHLVYVLRVGGDFMAGRFFAATIVAGAALLAVALSRLPDARRRLASVVLGLGIAAVATSTAQTTIASPTSYTPSDFQIPPSGVIDERRYYYWATGLLSSHRTYPISHPYAVEGLALRESGSWVVVGRVMGFMGYFAGPGTHIIDVYALCDPLLARLPVSLPSRIGHFEREIPAGYRETLESGRNQIDDPALALVYDNLRSATRDPLFAAGRLRAIVFLNGGAARATIENSRYAAAVACHNSRGSDRAACAR